MHQDYTRISMVDYISNLLKFFYLFVDELEDKKLCNKINKLNINIDFASKSKRGDAEIRKSATELQF